MTPTRLLFVLLAAVAATGCDKPTVVNVPPAQAPVAVPVPGPPGPQGNTGSTGATGADGKTGGSTTVIVVPPPASAPSN